ncbi:protein of unknown function [Burkholderia multivorans]
MRQCRQLQFMKDVCSLRRRQPLAAPARRSQWSVWRAAVSYPETEVGFRRRRPPGMHLLAARQAGTSRLRRSCRREEGTA